jgi:protoheme ferro-lyase
LRAPKSQEGYAKLGGKSPLREITESQAAALEEGLKAKGLNAKVYVGMRYWSPFIEDAVEKVCTSRDAYVLVGYDQSLQICLLLYIFVRRLH